MTAPMESKLLGTGLVLGQRVPVWDRAPVGTARVLNAGGRLNHDQGIAGLETPVEFDHEAMVAAFPWCSLWVLVDELPHVRSIRRLLTAPK